MGEETRAAARAVETLERKDRILIVEDEDNARKGYEQLLQRWGYDVLGVGSAEEVLAKFADLGFDGGDGPLVIAFSGDDDGGHAWGKKHARPRGPSRRSNAKTASSLSKTRTTRARAMSSSCSAGVTTFWASGQRKKFSPNSP